MLIERKERLQATIDALEREQADLAAHLDTQILSDEQVQTITEFAEKVRGGLEAVTFSFPLVHLSKKQKCRLRVPVDSGHTKKQSQPPEVKRLAFTKRTAQRGWMAMPRQP